MLSIIGCTFILCAFFHRTYYLSGRVCGKYFAADIDFQQKITDQFSLVVGSRAADGVTVLLETLSEEDQNKFQLIGGMMILAFSATNIFIQIKNTFNEIYIVQPRAGVNGVKQLLDRVISPWYYFKLGFFTYHFTSS